MVVNASLINRILLVLGFVGLFISGFLSIAHSAGKSIPCGESGGCNDVLQHPSAYWSGIPVAYFGLLGYLVLTLLASARSLSGLRETKPFALAGFFISMVGGIVSLYLQYISWSEIHKWCYWCIGSAVTMVATWFLSAILVQKVDALREDEPAPPSDRPLILALPLVVIAGLGIASMTLGGKMAPAKDVEKGNMALLIPTDGHSFGDKNAPITIVEFADMFCPPCRVMTPKIKKFVLDHPGKVRVIYRHYPLFKIHQFAGVASAISEIADEKGLFFEYVKGAMAIDEKTESVAPLLKVAEQIGLDPVKIKERVMDTKDPIFDRIQKDRDAAAKLGVVSTPTFFVSIKGAEATMIDMKEILDRLELPPYKQILNGEAPAAK